MSIKPTEVEWEILGGGGWRVATIYTLYLLFHFIQNGNGKARRGKRETRKPRRGHMEKAKVGPGIWVRIPFGNQTARKHGRHARTNETKRNDTKRKETKRVPGWTHPLNLRFRHTYFGPPGPT